MNKIEPQGKEVNICVLVVIMQEVMYLADQEVAS